MRPRRQMAEPMSVLAVWSRRTAFFAAAVAAVAVLGLRGSQLEAVAGLTLLATGMAIAAIALLMSLIAFAIIWESGARGLGFTLTAMAISLLMLAPLGWGAYKGMSEPVVADVSTDLEDPPKFDAAFKLRPRGSNPIDTFPSEIASINRTIRPALVTAEYDVEPEKLFQLVTRLAEKRHWRIVDSRKPQRRREGRVEAVARTMILGLRDDVVIRLRNEGETTQVDLRSASRVGRSDLGTNAARIREFLADLNTAVEELPDSPAPRPQQRQPAKPRR